MLRLQTRGYDLLIEDLDAYAGAGYDVGLFPIYTLGDTRTFRPNTVYKITCHEAGGESYTCIIQAVGAPSQADAGSAVLIGDLCVVAVSAFLVELGLPELQLKWSTQVDGATCFAVYHLPAYQSFITHGELDIAYVSYNGNIVWSTSGKEIFTNGFALFDTHAEAIDWNNERYHIDLETGKIELIA